MMRVYDLKEGHSRRGVPTNPVNAVDPMGLRPETYTYFLFDGAIIVSGQEGDVTKEQVRNVASACNSFGQTKLGGQKMASFRDKVIAGDRRPWLVEVTTRRDFERGDSTVTHLNPQGTECEITIVNPNKHVRIPVTLSDGTKLWATSTLEAEVVHEAAHGIGLMSNEQQAVNDWENPIMQDPAMKSRRPPRGGYYEQENYFPPIVSPGNWGP